MFNILVEKEYNKLSLDSKKPVIGCLMMVKDEEARIHVSLDSVTGTVDCLIVYDTGSTDKTVEIITNHCEKHKLNLYMIQGEFTNFSESRNISLDYADTKNVHFCVLLDTNDELRGGDKLREFCKKELHSDNNAYLMCQHWWSGKYNKYFNTRLIRARRYWRYKGSVHEWMCDTAEKKGSVVFRMPDDIILYQDRTKDGNKSGKRFSRDKVMLLADHKKNPTETRVLFYLGQTCSCLGQKEDAFYYYKLRSELEGFQEEKFHSYLRCGELSEHLGYPWYDSMAFFMKAVENSRRAEPLIRIAQHYNKTKKWLLAFTFIQLACSLAYPKDAILFVDKHSYDYTRWHVMGIVAYYCDQYVAGKTACLKALEAGLNSKLDKNNLEFYIKKEKQMADAQLPLNKIQFINKTVDELKKQNSNIQIKKLHKMALGRWKNRHKK
jgi:glycosyltransferase involved in cell wall biosynthesis